MFSYRWCRIHIYFLFPSPWTKQFQMSPTIPPPLCDFDLALKAHVTPLWSRWGRDDVLQTHLVLFIYCSCLYFKFCPSSPYSRTDKSVVHKFHSFRWIGKMNWRFGVYCCTSVKWSYQEVKSCLFLMTLDKGQRRRQPLLRLCLDIKTSSREPHKRLGKRVPSRFSRMKILVVWVENHF